MGSIGNIYGIFRDYIGLYCIRGCYLVFIWACPYLATAVLLVRRPISAFKPYMQSSSNHYAVGFRVQGSGFRV